jgi:hypothetical protein
MIDLGMVCAVQSISIFNRMDAEQARAANLSIYSSLNARNWSLLATIRERDDAMITRVPLAKLLFHEVVIARYIRIELDGVNALHLDKVKVIGWQLTSSKLEFGGGRGVPTAEK